MVLAPDAELDDGRFDVVTIADMSRSGASCAGCRGSSSGAHVGNPEVAVRRAREVRIAADRPFALYADGDPIADLPVTVRTLPAAARVLVP